MVSLLDLNHGVNHSQKRCQTLNLEFIVGSELEKTAQNRVYNKGSVYLIGASHIMYSDPMLKFDVEKISATTCQSLEKQEQKLNLIFAN